MLRQISTVGFTVQNGYFYFLPTRVGEGSIRDFLDQSAQSRCGKGENNRFCITIDNVKGKIIFIVQFSLQSRLVSTIRDETNV